VRLRTQNGAVLTDFDEKALVTKTEPARGGIRNHGRPGAHATGHQNSSDWHDEVRDAVREATRAGLEAAREAVEAARGAADAAAKEWPKRKAHPSRLRCLSLPYFPPSPEARS